MYFFLMIIFKARSRAKVAFDLSEYRDFSFSFGDCGEANLVHDSDGCFQVMLNGQQELQCYLEFRPTEVNKTFF